MAAADIDAAANAASDAFAMWRDMPALERKKILIRIAEGIEARAEEIALCECWDTGQTIKFMSKAALRGAENFRYFADQVVQARDGQHLQSPTLMNITTRKPLDLWVSSRRGTRRSCCPLGRSRQPWRQGVPLFINLPKPRH